MKVLNLYAGLGGNRKLWEGVEVTALEMEPDIASVYAQQHPNDELIIGDAHQYLLDNHSAFDFVWSSPPCPTHSKMMKATRHDIVEYPDMRLYQEIIFLQHFFKGKWVVENVKPYYDFLIPPSRALGRHCFWSNFKIITFDMPKMKGFITKGTQKESEELKKWLGIHYEGNLYYKGNHCPGQILRNCVHPETGKYIFDSAMGIIRKQNEHQKTIFE